MKFLKKFNEMNYPDLYDYTKIIGLMKSGWGWGLGIIEFIDEFEKNSMYFHNPSNETDYSFDFHVFLIDKVNNRLKGGVSKDFPIRLGNWQLGTNFPKPKSIYNKLI